MNTNALVPLAPPFFNHQVTSQYFLIPTLRQHTETLVLTRTNHPLPDSVDDRPGYSIPFWDREGFHKRTLPAHDFLFDDFHFRPDYDAQNASSKYANVQDTSHTYDRDGLLNLSPMAKGLYVDLYL